MAQQHCKKLCLFCTSGLTAGPPMGRRASDCGAYSTLLAAKLIERNGGQRIHQTNAKGRICRSLFIPLYQGEGTLPPVPATLSEPGSVMIWRAIAQLPFSPPPHPAS
jgi:hypothetical protein